ncbi:glycosyltransferase family 4 protein [Geobacter argillaceus]|uniref:Glycosyltransferase involved in cell wall biosynthesis n=1 Tax=Geobacter argillaceus TaxID=345631 RepID=A0A562WR13_9BACT|nr:glycosyltransferase family 4 protein [Geobacter argillaceus]TWJ32596.1 glycosyltransferase involved in cell wall biosynthesis [Geobacter argillaceus]
MTDVPLKILMLAPTPYFADRGCHVRIYEEARTLTAQGHRVRIVTYHLGRDMGEIPTDRIVSIPWYRKLAAGPSWHKPYLDILLFFKALAVGRRFRPDLIHAHLHEGAFLGIFLKRLIGVPLLFDCQGSLTGEIIDHGFVRKGSLLARLFGLLERFINRRADVILTSSGPGARELVETWGVAAGKVLPLTDGVNTDEFHPMDRAEARRRLQLPPDRPVVAFLGVMNRYQGVNLLLEVVKIMQERGVPVHFLLMGFPDERYRQLAKEMGIAGLITFTGRIDYREAPFFLSASDVALSPKISLTEANGKLFNYLACGLPTLVFDTPINREILGDAALYARYPEPVDFADKLEKLLADPVLREDLAVRGRERAIAEHSWQSRGARLIAVYRRMLER